MPAARPKPVIVEWLDAWADLESVGESDQCKGHLCHAIGYLVSRDKEGITLAHDCDLFEGKWSYRFRHHIPAAMVKKVRKLPWAK